MNDFSFHGLPPRLNRAFDSNKSSGASLWNNPITRRSFLKRSGAATVGALVIENALINNRLLAQTLNNEPASEAAASMSKKFYYKCTADPKATLPSHPSHSANLKIGLVGSDGDIVELKMSLTMTAIGPKLGDVTNSITYAAASIAASIQCFKNGTAISGTTIPILFPVTWSSGSYTKTVDENTGVETKYPATTTKPKRLIASFKHTITSGSDTASSVTSVTWDVNTMVVNNQIFLSTGFYEAIQVITKPNGSITDVKHKYAPPYGSNYIPVIAPKVTLNWTTKIVRL
jgi:hypothetical protein